MTIEGPLRQTPRPGLDPRGDLILLFESVRDYAILLLDPVGRVTTWNAGAERIKGYRADEIIGKHFSIFYPPEDIASRKPQRELVEAERTGRFEDEGFRVRKDGTLFWANVIITALRGPSGELRGFGKITRDLTERKRLEQVAQASARAEAARETEKALELREREAQAFLAKASSVLSETLDYTETLNRLAFLLVPGLADWCGIDLLDEQRQLTSVAVAHVDPAKVALARELSTRYPPDMNGTTGAPNVIRTGKSEIYPEIRDEMLVAGAKDADMLRILRELGLRSAITVPIRVRGVVFGAMSLVSAESGRIYDDKDLTLAEELGRRAGMAIENARAYSEVRLALRLREEFISVAGHELRTPLSALKLQLQGVAAAFASGAVAQDPSRFGPRVQKAVGHVARLERLIDDLLDVSRLSSGRMKLELEDVDLVALVEEVVERHRDDATRAATPVSIQQSGHPVGRWDRSRLDQVVTNLLSNAIKYGRGLPITITVSTGPGTAKLTVQDRGIGIDPSDQPRIFGRFERAVSERHYGGLGLGLWIVRELVNSHRGHIGFDSTLGEGSRFTVELPLAGPPAEQETEEKASS